MTLNVRRNSKFMYWGLFAMISATILICGCSGDVEENNADSQREAEMQRERPKEQDDLRRKLQEEEEKREQAKRAAEQAERERIRKERQEELRKKAERESELRRRFDEACAKFNGAESSMEEAGNEVNFRVPEATTFYVVGESYSSDSVVYLVRCVESGMEHVEAVRSNVENETIADFADLYKTGRYLVTDGKGKVWIHGCPSARRKHKMLQLIESLRPLTEDLGNLEGVLSGLGIRLPLVSYRISLFANKTGKTFPVGVVKNGGEVKYEYVADAIKSVLMKQNKVALPSKPTRKKYKPTVILYDGDMVRKEMALTKVPKVFKHIGVSNYKTKDNRIVEEARRKWKELYDEAVRQEKKADDIAADYERRMAEYKQKVAVIQNRKISHGEVEQALGDYSLYIERMSYKPIVAKAAEVKQTPVPAYKSYECKYKRSCSHCGKLYKENRLTKSYCDNCYFCQGKAKGKK